MLPALLCQSESQSVSVSTEFSPNLSDTGQLENCSVKIALCPQQPGRQGSMVLAVGDGEAAARARADTAEVLLPRAVV